MDTTKQKLVDSIKRRLSEEISNQNPVKFLKKFEVEDYIDNVLVLYIYIHV